MVNFGNLLPEFEDQLTRRRLAAACCPIWELETWLPVTSLLVVGYLRYKFIHLERMVLAAVTCHVPYLSKPAG